MYVKEAKVTPLLIGRGLFQRAIFFPNKEIHTEDKSATSQLLVCEILKCIQIKAGEIHLE